MKHVKCGRSILLVLLVSAFCLLRPAVSDAYVEKKLAVLPFRIHSLEPLDHLKQGLQVMLTNRMAQKGFSVINPKIVNDHPMASQPLHEMRDLFAIGRDLGVTWLITGSLTQVGSKISLDLKVLDMGGDKPPFSIFLVEDGIDRLAGATEKGATSIYNQITGVDLVDSIKVTGNKRIESEAILAVVESMKGEELDQEKLDQDLRNIFKMGFFKDVSITTEDGPAGKIVIFNVVEKPSISKIIYSGNKKIKDDKLKEEVGVKTYAILNQNEIKQSINRLRDFYRQKGYYNVEIRESIKDLPNNEVSLTYQIAEGEKVYIRGIDFVGNTKFDDDELKDIMITSEKGWFSWITNSGLLDQKALEFDLHKITSFYHNHGYIKAKTGEPEVAYSEDKNGLTITIEIIEGEPYGVRDVQVKGDLIKPAEELMEKVKIKDQEFFSREVVRTDSMVLRDLYADDGYAYADIAPTVKEDDENRLVDITYNISKGEKVRFERINITGNNITRDKVIRREFTVAEGDYYNGKALQKGTANLHRLGFFEDVEVKTSKGSEDDLMVLDINVKERPTGSFSLGAGYSSFDKATGMMKLTQSNFMGYGQKVELSARIGGRSTQFLMGVTEPWFLGRPISAGFDLYKFEREYDEYTKDSFGGGLRFEYPIGIDEDYTRGITNYYYEDADIFDVEDDAALEIKDLEGNTKTSKIELGLVRNSKNSAWNATKGSYNSIRYEYAGGILGGDAYFDKIRLRSAWYFPLPWDTVFIAQGRLGWINGRAGGRLPTYEKFFLGGIDTLRGFEFASVSPRDPETDDKIGGERMMVYNLEYRFPLFKEHGISGLVFLDTGNSYTKEQGYDFGDMRESVGTGVRWFSPVGPIRLEYGFILDPRDDEPSGNWEVAFGGSFW